MPYETDQRLKGFLDTNQMHREQLCLALLAMDKRFSNVQPRHPRGGPDGGRDIQAVFQREQTAFGAVGFVNQADDSEDKKKRIKEKFDEDLAAALRGKPKPDAFVFLTNMNLTIGEKRELILRAEKAGVGYSEIFDRERLRIALDSPDGFALRFQYLGIPLSEEEQASFFAKWGNEINSVIATGFQEVRTTLDRLLFLMEASAPLHSFAISLELDRVYSASEIEHFRAFCFLSLKEPKNNIYSILFGSSDKSNRMRTDINEQEKNQPPGIGKGISGGQWDIHLPDSEAESSDSDIASEYKQVGQSSSIGKDDVKQIVIRYSKDFLIRLEPGFILKDFDEAMFLPFMNKSLAQKLEKIHVFANEYRLMEISQDDFAISDYTAEALPVEFSEVELRDPWVRIQPVPLSSAFHIRFSVRTPQRLFAPKQVSEASRDV